MSSLNRLASCTLLGLFLSSVTGPARADVVAVVSAKSTVATLSKSQVADIFLGKTTRFPDGAQAQPIDQAEGSLVRDEFYETFAQKSPAQVKSHWSKIIFTGRGQPPKAILNSVAVMQFIAANPNAISYIERSAVDGSVRVLNPP